MTVGSESECASLGGFYFPNESCNEGWCDQGACCSETVCTQSDAWNCIANGREYVGPGIACSTDPCEIGVGACCLGETCMLLDATACAAQGGTFLGPGTICTESTCVLGACCFPDGCFDGPFHQCAGTGGEFVPGLFCADLACVEPSLCPDGTLFGQSPDGPKFFTAMTSEASANLQRSESFFAVGGAIESVRFWGLDLDYLGGGQWAECMEFDPPFLVQFRLDAAGVPGAVVHEWNLVAERIPTGTFYIGAELNEYVVALPEPVVLTHGWITIAGTGDPECWFLWMSAGQGFSWCDFCLPSQQDLDLAFCLTGTEGGVFGACCDDATGTCADDVEITECLGPFHRFVPDATCASLEPECGVLLGACCFADDTCTIVEEKACAAAGGLWLGADSICESCPCVVPCPTGGSEEGERTCFDGYIDSFNGGCFEEPFAVSDISFGETVCGTGGVFVVAGSFVGDFDWYQVTVDRPTFLSATVRAQFRPSLQIGDGTFGCPATLVASGVELECNDLTVEALVGPGVYFLVVGPFGATDSAACGAEYRLSLAGPTVCIGDLDGDNAVTASDLGLLLGAWGSPTHDLDGDGIVDAADLAILLGAWGICG